MISHRLSSFQAESGVKRAGIVAAFAELRAVLDCSERSALVAFDGEVRCVVKQLSMECDSLEVKRQQVAALMEIGCGEVVGDDVIVDGVSTKSVDSCVGVAGLNPALGECWKVVSCTSDDPDEQVRLVLLC